MHTRPLLAGLGLLLGGLCTAAALAAEPPPQRHPIRPPFDCIQVNQINAWHVLNDRSATVANGPKKFLVMLQSRCPQLSYGPPTLRFRPSRSNLAMGQPVICGEMGESVGSDQPPPCPIQSVERISKSRYKQLNDRSKRAGSGANQPTRP